MTEKTQKSQNPQTARLARKIRKLRERKKNRLSWKNVCSELRILKENGDPDTGLAYKIAYEDYEPSGREVRQRLGLKDICTKCKRSFRVPAKAVMRSRSAARTWFDRLKGDEKEKIIQWAYSNYLKWQKERKNETKI